MAGFDPEKPVRVSDPTSAVQRMKSFPNGRFPEAQLRLFDLRRGGIVKAIGARTGRQHIAELLGHLPPPQSPH